MKLCIVQFTLPSCFVISVMSEKSAEYFVLENRSVRAFLRVTVVRLIIGQYAVSLRF